MLKLKLDLTNIKSKTKKLMSRKHAKPILAVALVCIIGIGTFTVKTIISKKSTSSVQQTAKVIKGNLKITVTGSGAVESTNETTLYAETGADVTKVNYKEGDVVKKGDVIAELDDSDYQSTLSNNENSFLQSQISAQSSSDDIKNLTIKAPFSGQVSSISVKAGDEVNSGGTILTISDPSRLKVLLTYSSNDAAKIAVGQSASVYITSLMESISGTVSYISNKSTTTASGGSVYTVEITMDNPGAITEGSTASADIATNSGTVTSIGTASISYVNKKTVTSSVSGTVQSVYVKENQDVSNGTVLVFLKNDTLTRSMQTANLKVQASQTSLSQSEKQASKYKIVAPCDGTITTLNYKVGDTVKAGDEFGVIYDPNQMQFQVDVDELDISKLSIGQDVNITLDAISSTSETPMTGTITKIAVVGTSSNGVTTYPVTIQFTGDITGLKGGMNANGEIVVNELKNVLYVPLEAVTTTNKKSYVWVKENGSSSSKSSGNTPQGSGGSSSNSKTSTYYAGAVKKEVTTGENTDSYIIIKSGLSEGDTIVLPQTTSSSSSKTTTKTSSGMGGGMGGPGGGM